MNEHEGWALEWGLAELHRREAEASLSGRVFATWMGDGNGRRLAPYLVWGLAAAAMLCVFLVWDLTRPDPAWERTRQQIDGYVAAMLAEGPDRDQPRAAAATRALLELVKGEPRAMPYVRPVLTALDLAEIAPPAAECALEVLIRDPEKSTRKHLVRLLQEAAAAFTQDQIRYLGERGVAPALGLLRRNLATDPAGPAAVETAAIFALRGDPVGVGVLRAVGTDLDSPLGPDAVFMAAAGRFSLGDAAPWRAVVEEASRRAGRHVAAAELDRARQLLGRALYFGRVRDKAPVAIAYLSEELGAYTRYRLQDVSRQEQFDALFAKALGRE